MQLRKPKLLRALDDHYRRIWHIYPHFYHRSRHHDLRVTTEKASHIRVPLLPLLPPIYPADPIGRLRKPRFYVDIAPFKVLIIHLFGLLDQWKNNIHLPPLSDLMPDKIHHLRPPVLETMKSRDWLASGRQFVHHTIVQIAIGSHRERPRDRRGRHDQHMRRDLGLLPQPRPLRHPKPVL